MTKGKILAVVLSDMDGVLCGWQPTVYELIEQDCARQGIPVPKEIQKVQRTWKLKTDNPAANELLLRAMSHKTLYRDLPILPGAREGLEALVEAGHDVFLCSTPASHNEDCASHKFAWVREHLGAWWVDRTILTADKTMVFGDYLIDDKPEIFGHRTPTWEHIVFDASYNQETPGRRLKEWKDVCELLA